MYIERLIDKDLLEWKDSPARKPLLLRGARQVGKSSSVRHFSKEFDYFIEVNFEKREEIKVLFEKDINVQEIATKLGIIYDVPIIPGRTLIFLDEIQACPNAIKGLWFFKEDMPELHVIAAGSLLEFTLKEISSFGVGRIRSMYMYPLSFDEFLMAEGKESLLAEKRKASPVCPLLQPIHDGLVKEFRQYIVIGGMPASVASWINTGNYLASIDELEDIQQTYYDDFAKYSRSVEPALLRNTLFSVAAQIGNKFMYSKVEGGYRQDDVKAALSLLSDAGIIKEVKHTAANGLPLGAEVNEKFKKYVYLDSGLLLRILDFNSGNTNKAASDILLSNAQDLVNKGSITEMIVGWEMLKYSGSRFRHDLFYWESPERGATSEVDYIIAKDGNVLPIEVKSGTSGKMKSLRLFMEKKNIAYAVRTSLENFSRLSFSDSISSKNIDIIPLYALSNLIS
ncbi:MAG: ATP-binding protein [Muribaculaceae bacterium]